jgi:hypothetical protein
MLHTSSYRQEALSSEDIDILRSDQSSQKKISTISIKALSFLIPTTALLLYIDGNMLALISGVITGSFLVALPIAHWKLSRINADIKSNHKLIVVYKVEKKSIEGWVKPAGESSRKYRSRSIEFDDQTFRLLLDYKKMKATSNAMTFFVNQSDTLDLYLSHSYKLKVRSVIKDKVKEFAVPIEDFVVLNVGDEVEIAFAERTEKVFTARSTNNEQFRNFNNGKY